MENRVSTRVIEAHNVYSTHLSEERTIKVYVPPNYDSSRKYPVLYCHDGLEFFTHGRIATLANERILRGELKPFFIVGVAVNMKWRIDDYSLDGTRHDAYMRFIREECVPLVEEHYSVDESERWMAGISLGAVASVSAFLRYPNLFHKFILFSGAFYDSVRERMLVEPTFRNFLAYMVVGKQETEVVTARHTYDFYHANQAARDIFLHKEADIEYVEEEGTHIWGFWQAQIPAALAWFNQKQAAK